LATRSSSAPPTAVATMSVVGKPTATNARLTVAEVRVKSAKQSSPHANNRFGNARVPGRALSTRNRNDGLPGRPPAPYPTRRVPRSGHYPPAVSVVREPASSLLLWSSSFWWLSAASVSGLLLVIFDKNSCKPPFTIWCQESCLTSKLFPFNPSQPKTHCTYLPATKICGTIDCLSAINHLTENDHVTCL
jgi:hypothetical protein